MIYPYTNLPTDSSRKNPKIDRYSQIINHQPTIRKPTSPAILRIHFDSGADQTIAYGHRLINGWSRCLHTQGSHQSLQLQAIVWIVIFPNKSEIQFVCMVPYTSGCFGGHQLLLQIQGSTPTSGSGTGAELRGMEALRPTSNSQGKHLNCSFSHGLRVIVYKDGSSKRFLKDMNFNVFRFYNFWVPKFLGKAQALPTLGTTMGRAEISCCNCCFKRALVWHFWRSGGWLAIWIERLNIIIKLESCSYGFILLIRNLNNGFGFH